MMLKKIMLVNHTALDINASKREVTLISPFVWPHFTPLPGTCASLYCYAVFTYQ